MPTPIRVPGVAIENEGIEVGSCQEKLDHISVRKNLTLPVSEGLAAVFDGKRWGYIDKSGKVVIPFRFNWAREFSEGLAEVIVDVYKTAFIDKSGNYVIPPSEFTTLGINAKFKNGLVYVSKSEDGKQYEGYIN
ncbi:MAG: WG repeat-containing protein, partial [Acidobacteria bacterium]|nr:WG repeat-containing protein [Acidobacteriota bacterium]